MISPKVNYGVLIVALVLTVIGFGSILGVGVLKLIHTGDPVFLIMGVIGAAILTAFIYKVKLWRHL